MSATNRRRFRAAGVIAIAIAVVGVAFMLYADSRVAGSVVARPVGWIAPLVALAAVAGVGWILLGQRQADDREDRLVFDHMRCPACEREILGKWRMCPYCGSMIEQSDTASVIGGAPADR